MSVWWTFKAINLNVGDKKQNKFTSHSKNLLHILGTQCDNSSCYVLDTIGLIQRISERGMVNIIIGARMSASIH